MNKDDLNKFTQPVIDAYNSIENELLTEIAAVFKNGKDLLEKDADAWKVQMLNNLDMLDKAVLQKIKNKGIINQNKLINEVLLKAGIKGIADNEEEMKKLLKAGAPLAVPPEPINSPKIMEILKSYQNQAEHVLNLTNASLIKNSKQIFLDIVNKTALLASTGTRTGHQALRQTIREWAQYGIPVLKDKAGRNWGVEGYVRMVMVSTTNNVVEDMQNSRFDEYGIDLVEVSAHAGARPLCAPYQGKVYSRDGSNKKYPSLLDTSMGQPAGLFGINCGHYKYAYVDGISQSTYKPYPKKENADVYQQSQKQRALERGIRKAKTQYNMFKAAGDDDGMKEATQLIANRQKAMRKFIDETGRTRRRDREQLVNIDDIKIKKIPPTKKPKPEPIPIPKDHSQIPDKLPTQQKQAPEPKPKPEQNPDVKFKSLYNYVKVANPKNHVSIPDGTLKDLFLQYAKDNGLSSYPNAFKELQAKAGVLPKPKKIPKPKVHTPKPIPQPHDIDVFDYHWLNSDDPDVVRDNEMLKGKISSTQSDALKTYTGSSYSTMNKYLRFGGDIDNELKRKISNIDKFFETNVKPLSKNTIVTRKAGDDMHNIIFGNDTGEQIKKLLSSIRSESDVNDAFRKKLGSLEKDIVGTQFTDKAILSTSRVDLQNFRESGGIDVQMYMPKGSKDGVFVEGISYFSREKEFVIKRGQRWKIFDVGISFDDGYSPNLQIKVVPID